ncbi:hypothetical protein PLICRDRAFT_373544 [Plicaturopsis crispa FD-325 SS-3]|uniref:Cobalamin-independent methionine synthase MetE C-terminal/archaeal domain-containing protein n=1 Tax=Plicaturopsis crispa FD-325 SS-3 TaxID=944288 RepID=A0A0C9SQZ7_PLICR|nr:hypothetical protein PLICRDRAFT_373544 [Plicaturopsis crispa FD-325 SS-3]
MTPRPVFISSRTGTVTTMASIVNRPEHVGSFLRPASIHAARKRVHDATTEDEVRQANEALRTAEDEAIAVLVQKQEDAGLRGISDGEFRREYFHLDFLKRLGGVSVEENRVTEGVPPRITVTGTLAHTTPVQLADFLFVQSKLVREGSCVKVAIPSPTMVHFRGGRAGVDIASYPDMDVFFEDLARVWRAEITALAQAGCKYLQLDDTNLAYLCSEEMRAAAAARGEDVQTLPRQYAALINDALRDRPADMTVAIHLCRGNFRSQHFASGGYEPVAEVLLKDLNVDVYLLEYDDARSGGFEPLRHLPVGPDAGGKTKTVVLGLISSKTGVLEDKSAVVGRIREAAAYAPLAQLSVGPQCGFASTVHGNELTEEQQWAKIRLCHEVVEEVWGKQQ